MRNLKKYAAILIGLAVFPFFAMGQGLGRSIQIENPTEGHLNLNHYISAIEKKGTSRTKAVPAGNYQIKQKIGIVTVEYCPTDKEHSRTVSQFILTMGAIVSEGETVWIELSRDYGGRNRCSRKPVEYTIDGVISVN